jgi:hypothetical protein
MATYTGAAVNIAHSCSICEQVVINLDGRVQKHILGQLGELKQQVGADQCERLQQYVQITKAEP